MGILIRNTSINILGKMMLIVFLYYCIQRLVLKLNKFDGYDLSRKF